MTKLAPTVHVESSPTFGISWGNFVGIVAVAMFVVYLIAKGRLGVYLGLLGLQASGSSGIGGGPVSPGFGTGATSGGGNVIQFPNVNFGPLTL